MRPWTSKASLLMVSTVVVSTLGAGLPSASAQLEWTGEPKEVGRRSDARFPEDRYAPAGGCYAVAPADGGYLERTGDGYAATAPDLESAQTFYFQATDLGRYLLFDTEREFLAASEGALAKGTYAVTRSIPGQIVGGVVLESTDVAADAVAHSEANRASGRGASVISATEPDELADWKLVETDGRGFTVELPATDQALVADGTGTLDLAGEGAGSVFDLERTEGCTRFPEVDVNVRGPIMGGQTGFQEVRGFMDLHLHGMAFEFLGGRARCARPWSPYGVTKALVDCPDHHPSGEGAALEQVLSGKFGGHAPDGWPTFKGWPRYDYLTHEQMYYKWLERAWRGGLRLYTNLLVDNAALCKIYPYKSSRSNCNEMDGVRLQHRRILQLQDYIDAQSGGPGEGWFRIVTDPFQAREVINSGRLAVILGIEVSTLFDCGLRLDQPLCDKAQIDAGLDEVFDMGVRQMELVNKFDSALSGVTGDAGETGIVVNQGNKEETGNYWKMDTCPEDAGHAHDKPQTNLSDNSPLPKSFTGRDSLVASILSLAGTSGVAPTYPPTPHCNVLGLSELGEYTIRGMAERGMLFDPDHMSASARTSAMDLIDELGYSGVLSSHGWADETIYPRIYEAGGVVTPSDTSLQGFIKEWEDSKSWSDDRFYFGFGYGSDVNGFSSSAPPIQGTTVTYPFEGFGGAIVDRQVSGQRVYDINTHGVAHYGLYTDWIQGLRQLNPALYEDMTRGAEAYLQMWERAVGVPGDACRSDIGDLTDADIREIRNGMTPKQVLFRLGQPAARSGNTFTYCVGADRTATVTFSEDGRVTAAKACPNRAHPVASPDGRPSSRDHALPGNSCGH